MSNTFYKTLNDICTSNNYDKINDIVTEIERAYCLSLLIKFKYYIKNNNLDLIDKILIRIKNNLIIEYLDFYIYILSINNISSCEKYNVFDNLLNKYINNEKEYERIMISYLQYLKNDLNESKMIEVMWKQENNKYYVLNLLSQNLIERLFNNQWDLCVQDVNKANNLLKLNNNYILDSNYECYTNQIMIKSYFDTNTKDYSILTSECLRKYMPHLNYSLNIIHNKNKKLRIGYISSFSHLFHSVFVLFQGNIKYAPDDVDIYTFFFQYPPGQINIDFLNSLKNPIILNVNNNNLENIRDKIASYNLDIIVYLESLENNLIYYLSHSRLARIQITSFGYCDTSGVSTIDYYISSKLFEPENAEEYYSEKLIKLNNLGIYLEPDYININYNNINNNSLIKENCKFYTREELGFNSNIIIISCIQTELKFSKDFIQTLCAILNENENTVILLKGLSNHTHYNIKDLIDKYVGSSRIIYVNTSNNLNLYHNYIYCSDILLTPYPFGGFFTSLDGFMHNKPIVTLEGKKLMGRFTSGFYKIMNIKECVATNNIEYLRIVKKLCDNPKFRKEISEKIKENKHKLYYSKDSLNEWYECLKNLGAYI